jgi:adenylate cyclase class IV
VRNIFDTKARCPDLRHARQLLIDASAIKHRHVRQEDTYFEVKDGWLKLRAVTPADDQESPSGAGELVAYRRWHTDGPSTCVFYTTSIRDTRACRDALAAVLGIRIQVRKRREEWNFRDTIIHLDEVDRLGSFIEFETEISATDGVPNTDKHLQCMSFFGVRPDDAIRASYGDLLLADGSLRPDH